MYLKKNKKNSCITGLTRHTVASQGSNTRLHHADNSVSMLAIPKLNTNKLNIVI